MKLYDSVRKNDAMCCCRMLNQRADTRLRAASIMMLCSLSPKK